MKINQIVQETTTSGSVAPVEHGFVKMQTRNPGVYGNTKAGSLFKGKKTKAPYANSINEGAMKQLSSDLKGGPDGLSDQEFQKKYKMSKQAARQELASNRKQSKPEPVSEAELAEDDIILVPGQGRKMKTGFVPHGKSRVDHEVEMARSDLISAAKNAESIYRMIESTSEDEGLQGWVQEKIIKANDYLNSVREYLEGKQIQGVAEGLEQPKEAFQAIQKLQRFAQDNPDFTLQQLDTLPSRGNPIKPMFANANLAIDTLIQAYKTRKELGNAEFLKQLKDEINYFLTDRTASQDPTTLGDLLTGKLGKINFQQGVAEGSEKKTPGIALSKAYKKDFDNKKPGHTKPETALTGTYSKTGKPGGDLKKQGVEEGKDAYGPVTDAHKAASKKVFAAGVRDGKAGAEKNKQHMASALMKTTYLNGYKQGAAEGKSK